LFLQNRLKNGRTVREFIKGTQDTMVSARLGSLFSRHAVVSFRRRWHTRGGGAQASTSGFVPPHGSLPCHLTKKIIQRLEVQAPPHDRHLVVIGPGHSIQAFRLIGARK
jgi:hypothetical protein